MTHSVTLRWPVYRMRFQSLLTGKIGTVTGFGQFTMTRCAREILARRGVWSFDAHG